MMFDKLHEECGVFGICGHPEASKMAYLGLYALQHRGQESAGIAASDGQRMIAYRAMGHVADVFTEGELARLAGSLAVGHVRYSTAGASKLVNAQPILIDCQHGQIALCHNGNLVNASELRDDLVRDGAIFQTSSDSEVVLHLYARSRAGSVEEAIIEALAQIRGAFSLVLATKDCLIAVRDPHGFRPLAMGRLGDATVIASETCAMDLISATWERDVEPGEIVIVSSAGVRSIKPFPPAPRCHCIFEHVYFARPDSYVFGESVNSVRTEFGRLLAREAPVPADVVVPVPDSGVCAATGYAEEAGLPLRMGLIRNHYVGRTFIEPQQSIRHFGVKVKLNPVRSILDGQRVVLVDDSIVRGTTSRKIVRMIKAAGAREVHVRISCPPTISPCFYGVDTPRRSELIAATHTLEEIRKYLEADSLQYLSLEGLLSAVNSHRTSYCTSCYTGHYPLPFPKDQASQVQLPLRLVERP
ncbi:MAG TPA: amidophosphoribosyltransferase [Vicinamibacterales bacterium]|jgi:amidophosphoribosyltransferase